MWHMRLHHFCHLSLQKRDAWWERLRTMRDRNWYLKLIGDWQTHQKKHQNQTVLASLCHLIIKIQSHLWSMAIRDVSQLLLTTISSPENITNYHLPHLFKSSKFLPPPPSHEKRGPAQWCWGFKGSKYTMVWLYTYMTWLSKKIYEKICHPNCSKGFD